MTIKKLIGFIGSINIAEDIDKKKLMRIGEDVVERFNEDLTSMEDWHKSVEKGMKLVKPELQPKSQPWEGASNFKTPVMTEASLQFGNRSSLELLRQKNLVKSDVIGRPTQLKAIQRDETPVKAAKAQLQQQAEQLQQQVQQLQQAEQQGQPIPPEVTAELEAAQTQIEEQTEQLKQAEQELEKRRAAMEDKQDRADRVTEVMNYQVNHQMKEWRPDQKKLLYVLPNVGTVFKKTLFDPLLGRNISHVIHYPDFAVNQATTHIDTARSFTHILDISKNKLFENQKSEIWLDEQIYTEESDGDEGSNEAESSTDATDNPNRFLEQYCFVDLDGDGYEEPYIVTVHEQTRKVMRIVARYDQKSIMVSDKQGNVISLIDAMKNAVADEVERADQAKEQPNITEDPDLKGMTLARIEAAQSITKYGFIPTMDGTFLDLGYFHLMGSTTEGINATTNQLVDSGTLANLQGGFLAKGFRKKMGAFRVKMGQWLSTNVPAMELAQGIFPFPTKEPSQTLFALNEKLTGEARSFAASVDASGQLSAQTAPTTALAVIQEALIPLSALMSNIIESESNEFQLLFKLNQKFADPKEYQEILDDPKADSQADFNAAGMDIVPTANAEQSSKMQRIQLATVQLSLFPQVVQAQGNPIPLVRAMLEAIGSDITEEVFPDEERMSAQDQKRLDGLREEMSEKNRIEEEKNAIGKLQVKLLERAEDRKDFEAQAGAAKDAAEVRKIAAEIILLLEKAETEEIINRMDKYTKRLEELSPEAENEEDQA